MERYPWQPNSGKCSKNIYIGGRADTSKRGVEGLDEHDTLKNKAP